MRQSRSPRDPVDDRETIRAQADAVPSEWLDGLIDYARSSLDLVAAEAELAANSFTAILFLMLTAAGLVLSSWLGLCGAVGYWLVSTAELPMPGVLLILSGVNLLLFAVCVVTSRLLVKDVGFPRSRRHFFRQ